MKTTLVVGRRVAVNKSANGEESGFWIAGKQRRSGGKDREKKEERIVNEGGQGARILLQEVEANAERRTRRSASRSTVLCRPVAMTGYDPSHIYPQKIGTKLWPVIGRHVTAPQ